MRQLLVVHGMKRSGNHAVINWLRAQTRSVFFNNIIPVARVLAGHAAMPEPQQFQRWLSRRLWSRRVRCLARRQWIDLCRLARPLPSVIVSLEDLDLDVRPFRDPPAATVHVVILREAANLFASRIRKAATCDRHVVYPRGHDRYMQRAVRLWKSHAREFLGISHRLGSCLAIGYDRWLVDERYRRSLAGRLGIPFSDAGLQRVSGVGGGSSFDGTDFCGRPQAMNLLNRAEDLSCREREILELVLRDRQLRELNEAVSDDWRCTATGRLKLKTPD